MNAVSKKGAEEARNQLPNLLDDAERGKTTIITRHGKPVAALVPLEVYEKAQPKQQASLLDLAGTGKGLWGENSTETLRKLRDEWDR
jgi:prevent-host-death family protein